MLETSIGMLFTERPRPMGLRGDRGLWEEMGRKLAHVPLPQARDELSAILTDAYQTATGQSIDDPNVVVIERFNRGGMSGGMISPRFWLERGIPTVLDRYDALRTPATPPREQE